MTGMRERQDLLGQAKLGSWQQSFMDGSGGSSLQATHVGSPI